MCCLLHVDWIARSYTHGFRYAQPILQNCILMLCVLLIGCGPSPSSVASSTTTNSPIVMISTSPTLITIGVNETYTFSANGIYPDGKTSDISNKVIWSVKDVAIAQIHATTGVATGIAVGRTTITAIYNGNISAESTLVVSTANNIITAPVCGSKTTCDQMRTCSEAKSFYQYCGLSRLDGNNDGIPCETLCY